jgi:hypothetical protein
MACGNMSCESAIHSILDHWLHMAQKSKIIVSLFIDFKKAFDTVDPKLLHRKLFHYGFDNCALNLIANYFEGRQQCVKINQKLSNMHALKLGVPQGSIIGPIFFLIFINDLSFILDDEFIHVLFADDTTASVEDATLDMAITKLQAMVNLISSTP